MTFTLDVCLPISCDKCGSKDDYLKTVIVSRAVSVEKSPVASALLNINSLFSHTVYTWRKYCSENCVKPDFPGSDLK